MTNLSYPNRRGQGKLVSTLELNSKYGVGKYVALYKLWTHTYTHIDRHIEHNKDTLSDDGKEQLLGIQTKGAHTFFRYKLHVIDLRKTSKVPMMVCTQHARWFCGQTNTHTHTYTNPHISAITRNQNVHRYGIKPNIKQMSFGSNSAILHILLLLVHPRYIDLPKSRWISEQN